MPTTADSNKRIAKNTLMLYVRMLFTMIVSLYTSRVVLNTLGVSDYGIYNVVGGVVTMFTFLNGAMSSATQRYLNFDIGQHNSGHLKTVFRTAMQIHFLISIIVLVLGETIGLWFVCTQLNIPSGRMSAAIWVYQFSIFSCIVSIISLPYTADIIAHERMGAFAYISIFDVTMKLLIVYLLVLADFDKLKFYALLLFCVQVLDRIIYNIYCKHHFAEVNFSFCIEKPLFKEMSSFAGWSLWGNIAAVLFTQGVNILLNMFFGPVVNAARGIAVQVQGVVRGFVDNIQTAVNPQITKSYAADNLERMHKLIFASSKFCFFLLFLIVLPLSIEAKRVLTVWLKIVPDHTVWFLRLILCIMLIETLANPFVIANQATGKVKVYQAITGGILLLIIPIAYIVLKFGGDPESVFVVHLSIVIIAQVARILLMRPLIHLKIRTYIRKVIVPILAVVIVSPIFPLFLYLNTKENVSSFFGVCILCVFCTFATVYFLGVNKSERTMMIEKVRTILHKKFHK